eukprot:6180082-Pleurochrysis_carterae.AAC.1
MKEIGRAKFYILVKEFFRADCSSPSMESWVCSVPTASHHLAPNAQSMSPEQEFIVFEGFGRLYSRSMCEPPYKFL